MKEIPQETLEAIRIFGDLPEEYQKVLTPLAGVFLIMGLEGHSPEDIYNSVVTFLPETQEAMDALKRIPE